MTIFISYAREDANMASRLYEDLRARDLQPWLDVKDLLPGERWAPAIRRKIRESSHFVALLSKKSISKRGFYQKELNYALDVLHEIPPDQIFVIPARLDEVEPVHETLRELNWVDLFPSYGIGLDRILRALNAMPPQEEPAGDDSDSRDAISKLRWPYDNEYAGE